MSDIFHLLQIKSNLFKAAWPLSTMTALVILKSAPGPMQAFGKITLEYVLFLIFKSYILIILIDIVWPLLKLVTLNNMYT